MSQELMYAALRVLACYTTQLSAEPDASDVALLRQCVKGGESEMRLDLLAVHIVEREITHNRAKPLAAR
jgi:hypothetical protein